MDTTKKIIIGAIGAAVVVGAVSIGLIFGLAPADTDHTYPGSYQCPGSNRTCNCGGKFFCSGK